MGRKLKSEFNTAANLKKMSTSYSSQRDGLLQGWPTERVAPQRQAHKRTEFEVNINFHLKPVAPPTAGKYIYTDAG